LGSELEIIRVYKSGSV